MDNIYISVDGTDCRIEEPSPFSTAWYSHKFNGPGVRYEVAVSIHNGYVMWANGPYTCGRFPDQNIFNLGLSKMLGNKERVIADSGYSGLKCLKNYPGKPILHSRRIRARNETVNRRFKHFNVLGKRFRHNVRLHSFCFHAVCNLT